jgi:2,3-bisphosphoglycerate-dependent phosphoglycerate mutase
MTQETVREIRQFRFVPPPGACELLLVRHGESAPSRVGEPFELADGHGDPPLSEDGRWQAERVGERLADEHIDAVYVTTLRRTAETAAPLLARLGVEASVEPDLREVFLGEWEGGVFRQKVADGDPIAQRMFLEERWDVIPGAEPHDDFVARVRGAISRLAERHPDQRLVVVSHGGVIGLILHLATDARPFAFSAADNGSIHHLVIVGDRWIVRRYNDTAHLGPFTTAAQPVT